MNESHMFTKTMPFKTKYFASPEESLSFVNTAGFDDSKNGMFDQMFSIDVEMEQWQDWMKWDGSVDVEVLNPLRRQQTSSTISDVDSWSADMESIGTEALSATFTNANEFPFGVEFTMDPNMSPLLSTRARAPEEVGQPSKNYPTLTEAEIQALQAIAMPYRTLSEVDSGEPLTPMASDSPFTTPTPSPEPEVRGRKNKKRKSIGSADVPMETCQSRKRGHNAIEKRYRTNLNDKINCLRDGVPSLATSEPKSGDDIDDDSDVEIDGKGTQQKYGKAAVLTRALEYIKHLECTTKRLGGDVDSLKLRVGAFEKLAMSGNKMSNSGNMSMANDIPVKSETLESIQSEFQQIKPRRKSVAVATPVTRKRSAKQAKKL